MTPETPFSALVQSAFRPLSKLGFTSKAVEPRSVRLENDVVALDVRYGRASYAIDITISRLGSDAGYSLYEVLSVFASERVDLGRLQVPDRQRLPHFLEEIASVLEERCAELLQGDAAAVARVAASTAESRRAATLTAEYGAILDRGDRAWFEHDRIGAAELYGAAEPALDPTRRRRLEFVRRSQQR